MEDIKYFAATQSIRTGDFPFSGEIEITALQYDEALNGMISGKIISVENGFEILDPTVEPDPAPVEPEDQEPSVPLPSVIAAAFNVMLVDGEIVNISKSAGIPAGFTLDVGMYMMFLTAPQEDTDYIVEGFAANHRVTSVENGIDYIIIQTTDMDNQSVHVSEFTVKLWR